MRHFALRLEVSLQRQLAINRPITEVWYTPFSFAPFVGSELTREFDSRNVAMLDLVTIFPNTDFVSTITNGIIGRFNVWPYGMVSYSNPMSNLSPAKRYSFSHLLTLVIQKKLSIKWNNTRVMNFMTIKIPFSNY